MQSNAKSSLSDSPKPFALASLCLNSSFDVLIRQQPQVCNMRVILLLTTRSKAKDACLPCQICSYTTDCELPACNGTQSSPITVTHCASSDHGMKRQARSLYTKASALADCIRVHTLPFTACPLYRQGIPSSGGQSQMQP